MDVLNKTLQDFIADYCEYLPKEIPVLRKPPKPVDFLNNYVNTSTPFVIKPRFDDLLFPAAVKKWENDNYLRELLKDCSITVAATPNGKADSIVDEYFMLPEERKMSFKTFLELLANPHPSHVLYLQKQNNCLMEEFSPLLGDVSADVAWATEAFGCPPEAANVWMGEHRSVTSLHKDHYENIYFVICGSKRFTLYPPISIAWMPYKKCPLYQWYFDESWQKKDLKKKISWISPDHKPETLEKFKMYAKTNSYEVEVSSGEALYLPAMWFHEVKQSDRCISVNYWYDMKYDLKYPYFMLLSTLGNLQFSRKDASNDTQIELENQLIKDLVEAQKKGPGKKGR